jgi:Flp pilus assembly protein TadD
MPILDQAMPSSPAIQPAYSPAAPPAFEQALSACLEGARALQHGADAAGLQHYRRAMFLAPDDATIVALYGVALRSVGRLADAQRELTRAIALDPLRADSYTQLAQTFRLTGDRPQAARAFLSAAALQPDNARAWRDAAESLRLADDVAAGLTAAQTAATLAPDDASVANTMALLLYRSGRLRDATALCERVRATNPDDLHLALTHGMFCRTVGQYDEGWALYERRLELPAMLERPAPPATPRWDGSPLAGRSILVRAEQGLGDQILFARWASALHARGAGRVVLQCAAPLVRLLRTMRGIDAVIATDQPMPQHDVHADCASLPHLVRTGSDMLASMVPYLTPPAPGATSCADAQAIATAAVATAAVATPRGARVRVGIVWAGSPLQEDDRFRSMPLTTLLAAVMRPDVEVVVLQQGPGRTQLDALDADTRAMLTDAAPACVDLLDTARIACTCDLIISVCTSVAHLAGALALPTWLLLATPAEWRWGVDSTRSAFYPSMRLHRQRTAGDWSTVMQEVAQSLAALAGARHG